MALEGPCPNKPPDCTGNYREVSVKANRLSQHALRAFNHAEHIARRLRHSFVDSEHLLLGIMAEEGCVASQVLTDMGLDMASVEEFVSKLHVEVPNVENSDHIPHSAGIELALSLAAEEAIWMGHHYIGTEHLLLGLVRWHEGGAVTVLKALGTTPDNVRRSVRRMMQAGHAEVHLEDVRNMSGFSEIARRVLNGATAEAAQAGHATVGIEHMLLVLCLDRRNVPGKVLRDMNVRLEALQELIIQLTIPSSLAPIFDAATSEASKLGNHYIGTDHFMLAICEHPSGKQILYYLNIDPEAVRRALLKAIASRA